MTSMTCQGARRACVLVLAAVVGGCAATTVRPPPGAAVAYYPAMPPPGVRWRERQTDNVTGVVNYFWNHLKLVSYRGREYYAVGNESQTVLDSRRTGNVVYLFQGGKISASYRPEQGMFSWPLWVGKTWISTIFVIDAADRIDLPMVTNWKCTGLVDVTVPAGTFKAFRIDSSPVENDTARVTGWYAPTVGLVIKYVWRNDRGPGKFTTELVTPPQ